MLLCLLILFRRGGYFEGLVGVGGEGGLLYMGVYCLFFGILIGFFILGIIGMFLVGDGVEYLFGVLL